MNILLPSFALLLHCDEVNLMYGCEPVCGKPQKRTHLQSVKVPDHTLSTHAGSVVG